MHSMQRLQQLQPAAVYLLLLPCFRPALKDFKHLQLMVGKLGKVLVPGMGSEFIFQLASGGAYQRMLRF